MLLIQDFGTKSSFALTSAAAFLMLAFAVGVMTTPRAHATEFVNIAGGASGGAYIVIASGMAKILEEHAPGVQATAQVTGGGFVNCRIVGTKKAEFGLTTPANAYFAINGGGRFKKGEKYPLMAVMGGHESIEHFTTRPNSDIKSIKDLRGRRVSMGQPGSATETIGTNILKAYGINSKTDIKPEYLTQTEAIAAVRDGTVDATIQLSGVPGGALLDLASSGDGRFIPIEPEMMEKIIKEFPYYNASEIPAGTYPGVDKAIPAVGAGTIVVTSSGVPDELVYKFTKAIIENAKELAEVHPAGKEYGPKSALRGIKIPIHPGAMKYYKEAGIAK